MSDGIKVTTVFDSDFYTADSKAVRTVQYNYNTTAIQELFSCTYFYCTCVDPCNTTLQQKFSTTCRKTAGRLLAAVVKKLVLQLHCNTTTFLCYIIAVVLHLCGSLKQFRHLSDTTDLLMPVLWPMAGRWVRTSVLFLAICGPKYTKLRLPARECP